MPQIFWVVGMATNMGKTSLTVGLIRALNERGIAALGFKPFAGMRLSEKIDFLAEHFSGSPSAMFTGDSYKVSRASSLTSDPACFDLVAPRALLFRHSIKDTLLFRVGSKALGNVRYFKGPDTDAFCARPDVARLFARTDLGQALETAVLVDGDGHQRHGLMPEAGDMAFRRLVTLGPKAIVCEGAGPFLPVWQGCPKVDHLFIVDGDRIDYHRDVGIKVKHVPGHDPLLSTRMLAAQLSKQQLRGRTLPWPRVDSAQVGIAAQEVMARFLDGAAR